MDKKKSLFLLTAAAAGTLIYNIWKPVKSDLPVIQNFNILKYLGQWYEIARMDFYWEKGLKNVEAHYSLLANDKIEVLNSGIRILDNKVKSSTGKAKFAGAPNEGALLVSFFGPFYSGYNIMHVDENYQYALVFGQNLDYLWILSRTKTIPSAVREMYIDYATQAGYAVEQLIWTIQE